MPPGAEDAAFNDSSWRTVDLPHDWSIEDLSPANATAVVVAPAPAPTPTNSPATGGGRGRGRAEFPRRRPILAGESWRPRDGLHAWAARVGIANISCSIASSAGKRIAIQFDGVYMDSDIWLNGHPLGNHPYGYTAFSYDLTDLLNPPGQDNVIAVRVRNTGRNSRWYSGSGHLPARLSCR